MISGFNTDIEFSGVTYHVQTEDKGLDSPLILSLVYTGGEILAAKRTAYEDLIESGFDEKILSERLQRQHRLICAAIKQGRIEDLKRMSARDLPAKPKVREELPKPTVEPAKPISEPMPTDEIAVELLEIEPLEVEPPTIELPIVEIPIIIIEPPARDARQQPSNNAAAANARVLRTEPEARTADFVRVESALSNFLNLDLLDAKDFRGGDRVALQIHVSQGDGDERADVADAVIMVKVLGAAFRPVILHAQTNEAGVAIIHLQLPSFRTGRAAILIKASHNNFEAELRRIVSQG